MKAGNHEVENRDSMESTLQQYAESVIQIDQYPRCLIQIIFRLVSANGSLLSTMCNAMIATLQKSGILLKRSGMIINSLQYSLEHMRRILR